jgi:hypothetical protein
MLNCVAGSWRERESKSERELLIGIGASLKVEKVRYISHARYEVCDHSLLESSARVEPNWSQSRFKDITMRL